jgi:hypothetical protein
LSDAAFYMSLDSDPPGLMTGESNRTSIATRKRYIPQLSKSRYMSGAQCHLRLWYECYQPELASDPDDAMPAIFATGHQVGELAIQRYLGGLPRAVEIKS